MIKRVIFDIIAILSVLILPWWLTAIIALIGIFVFSRFYEFIALGLGMYVLYAIPGSGILSSPIWFTMLLLLVYIGIQFIRRYIVLYKNEISY